MMQSMKGATSLLGSMNRQMNLPALQRIAMEFERENDIMDQRQEMMDDAIDDVTGLEDEEEEDEVVQKVLDEIGVEFNQSVYPSPSGVRSRADANNLSRLGRLQLAFRRTLLQRGESHRPLVQWIRLTMTFRHG
jgi:charged multivesicular body protein 2A